MMIGDPWFSRQFLLRCLMLSRRRKRRRNSSAKHGPSARGMEMLASIVRGSQSVESLLTRDRTVVLGDEPMAILVTPKSRPNTPACAIRRSPPCHRAETRSSLDRMRPNSWRQYPAYNHSISPRRCCSPKQWERATAAFGQCLCCASRWRSGRRSCWRSSPPIHRLEV